MSKTKAVVPDQKSRNRMTRALNTSMFVDAGAGTGKTTVLTQRVFNLVESGQVELLDLAVVTFTEKAARELKDRLRELFESSGSSQSKVALTQVDAAAIGTLHFFARRILSSYPIEAQLPLRLEVMDESESESDKRRDYARIFSAVSRDPRGKDLMRIATEAGVRPATLTPLIDALSENFDLIESQLFTAAPTEIPNMSQIEGVVGVLSDIMGECGDTDDKLYIVLEGIHQQLQDLIGRTESDRLTAAIGEKLVQVSSSALGGGGTKGAWGRTGKEVRDEVKTKVLEPLRTIGTELASWWVLPLVKEFGRTILARAQARKRSGQVRFHDLLVFARDLLATNATVRQGLRDEFKVVFLDEFQDTDPLQIEIAMRIAGGAQANQLNWRDIEIPEGSLFIVGDPKQAIYAFRRADVRLYKQVQEWMGQAGRGEKQALSCNFRSTPPLIEWVNQALAETMSETDTQAVFEPLLAGKPPIDLEGPAALVLTPNGDSGGGVAEVREQEAADIAAVIKEALIDGWQVRDKTSEDGKRPIRPADIAILFKARSGMDAVEEALAEAGIPYYSEARTRAYLNPTSKALIAAMSFLGGDIDGTNLLAALRSPLFGCSDADLVIYKTQHGSFRPVKDDEGLVARSLNYLWALRHRAEIMTPAALLEALIQDRHALTAVAQTSPSFIRETYAAIRHLVDDARSFTQSQRGGLREYLGWVRLQEVRAARESEPEVPERDLDAVKLTTIHASKGLQYPMVILPSTAQIYNTPRGPQMIWGDTVQVRVARGVETGGYEAAEAQRKTLAIEEVERLLYVAATRAEDHLIVSLHGKSKTGRTTRLADLWAKSATVAQTETFAAKPSTPKTLEPLTPAPLMSLEEFDRLSKKASKASKVHDRGTPTAPPKTTGGENNPKTAPVPLGVPDVSLTPEKGGRATEIGDVVHQVLSTLPAFDSQTENLIHTLSAQAKLEEKEVQAVLGYVSSALRSPKIQKLWAGQVHTEIPLLLAEDNNAIIRGVADMVGFTKSGNPFVLDYKTDRINNASDLQRQVKHHRRQLKFYTRALSQALGVKADRVKTFLVFLRPDGTEADLVEL